MECTALSTVDARMEDHVIPYQESVIAQRGGLGTYVTKVTAPL